MDFEAWEKQVENVKQSNDILFIEFEKYLLKKNLKTKTIKKHVENIKFYANVFLLREEVVAIENGSFLIGSFLGDFFIRKTTWASKYTIQENIVSFKKFYGFLFEKGKISKTELAQMKLLIKEDKKYWMSALL